MKKTILVTGGNRGIGLEICRQLAAAGHRVLIGSRTLSKGEAAAKQLRGDTEAIQLDVTQVKDIEQAAEDIKNKYGQLDVLINNCGIGVGETGAANADFEEVRNIMETNFYGAWQTTLGFLPLLKASPDPRLINMSSSMGSILEMPQKTGFAGYRISKTALNALSILLSNELKGQVTVNSMDPGWVKTEMGGDGADRTVEQGADTAVWLATAEKIPAGQFLRDRKVREW